MSDLIKRKDALKALQELDMLKESRWFPEVNQSPVNFVVRMFIEAENTINSLPSAEPERKKGKWVDKQVIDDADYGIPEWQSAKCSICGRYLTTPYQYYFDNYNFCPYCDADMRGDR